MLSYKLPFGKNKSNFLQQTDTLPYNTYIQNKCNFFYKHVEQACSDYSFVAKGYIS